MAARSHFLDFEGIERRLLGMERGVKHGGGKQFKCKGLYTRTEASNIPPWSVGSHCPWRWGTFPVHFAFHRLSGRVTRQGVMPEQVTGEWG
jgi:hypothetical protein